MCLRVICCTGPQVWAFPWLRPCQAAPQQSSQEQEDRPFLLLVSQTLAATVPSLPLPLLLSHPPPSLPSLCQYANLSSLPLPPLPPPSLSFSICQSYQWPLPLAPWICQLFLQTLYMSGCCYCRYLRCELYNPLFVPRFAVLLEAYLKGCGEAMLQRFENQVDMQKRLEEIGKKVDHSPFINPSPSPPFLSSSFSCLIRWWRKEAMTVPGCRVCYRSTFSNKESTSRNSLPSIIPG